MNISRAAVLFAIVVVGATGSASAQTTPSPAPPPAPQPSVAPSPAPQPSGGPSPGASPVPVPVTSPAPAGTTDANAAKARIEFEAWQNAKIDLSHYIPEAAAQFTDAVVKSLSDQALKPLGAVKTITQTRVVTTPVATIYVYHVVCANGAIDQAISWNSAGKIQYIQFVPPQS
jgi:hypothetical protein